MARKIATKATGKPTAPIREESVEKEPETSVEGPDSDQEVDDEVDDPPDEEDNEEILTPIPVKTDPVPSKRPRRNLAGVYTCKTCVRYGGVKHSPGAVLTLTDEEARHYLKYESVVPLD